jgi:hypothetical protein
MTAEKFRRSGFSIGGRVIERVEITRAVRAGDNTRRKVKKLREKALPEMR